MTDPEKQLFVYVGRRIDSNGKLHQVWSRFTPDGKLDGSPEHPKWWVWKKRVPGNHQPGAVVEFTGSQEGGYWTSGNNGPVFLRMFSDPQAIIHWRALDRQAAVRDDMRRVSNRKQKVDPLLESLEPLRKLYANMNRRDRAALLAVVIEYIQEPKFK